MDRFPSYAQTERTVRLFWSGRLRAVPLVRQPVLIVVTALLTLAMAAPAHAAPRLQVTGWTATLVNQEVVRVPPGGALPLCQAIPVVSLAPRLRWNGVRPGTDVRLRLGVPGHADRGRRSTLRRRSGSKRVVFTARDLRLRADAFEHGTYRVRIRLADRMRARSSVRLVAGGTC